MICNSNNLFYLKDKTINILAKPLSMVVRTSANTSNSFVIHLKFADILISHVWTFSELTRSISFALESNTYIRNMTNNCQSLNYLCFWPFVGQSRLNIRLWCHVTQITRINIWLITWKWSNIIWYWAEYYSIFTWRSNTLTANHH